MVRPSAFPLFENKMIERGKCEEIDGRRAYSVLCDRCPNMMDDGRCYLEEIEYHGLHTVIFGREYED